MTTYEMVGRFEKATKLAAHLHAHGITSSETQMIKPEDWKALAKAINVRTPSDETIKQVDVILLQLEAAEALQ